MRTRSVAARESKQRQLNSTIGKENMSESSNKKDMDRQNPNLQTRDDNLTEVSVDSRRIGRMSEQRLAMNVGHTSEYLEVQTQNVRDRSDSWNVHNRQLRESGNETPDSELTDSSASGNKRERVLNRDSRKSKLMKCKIRKEKKGSAEVEEEGTVMGLLKQLMKQGKETKQETAGLIKKQGEELKRETAGIKEMVNKWIEDTKKQMGTMRREIEEEVDNKFEEHRRICDHNLHENIQSIKQSVEQQSIEGKLKYEELEGEVSLIKTALVSTKKECAKSKEAISGITGEIKQIKTMREELVEGVKKIDRRLTNLENNQKTDHYSVITHAGNEEQDARTAQSTDVQRAEVGSQHENNCYPLTRQKNGLSFGLESTLPNIDESSASQRCEISEPEARTIRCAEETNGFVACREGKRDYNNDKCDVKYMQGRNPPVFRPDGELHILDYLHVIERMFPRQWDDMKCIDYIICHTYHKAQPDLIEMSRDSRSYRDFKNLLIKKYWSESKQDSVYSEIHEAPLYHQSKFRTMAEYFKFYWNKNKYLDAPIREHSFVAVMRAKLPKWMKQHLIGLRVKTVEHMIEILEEFDKLQEEENNCGRRSRQNEDYPRNGRQQHGNYYDQRQEERRQPIGRQDDVPRGRGETNRNDDCINHRGFHDVQDNRSQYDSWNKENVKKENWRERRNQEDWARTGAKPRDNFNSHKENYARNGGKEEQSRRSERAVNNEYDRQAARGKQVYALQATAENNGTLKIQELRDEDGAIGFQTRGTVN